MTTIKTYNCQDYKEYMIYPSETCFVSTETDLRQVAYYHLSKDIDENIEVLKRLKEVDLKNTTLIETKVGEKLLYLIVSDELTQKDIPHFEEYAEKIPTVEARVQKLVEKYNIQVETLTEESIRKDFEKDIENMPVECKEDKTQILIKEILLLPTFTYSHFSKGRKLEVAKAGVDLFDLHRLINQFRESSVKQSDKVCLSIT